jgi:acetyl-CoA C-acetyltransferase
MIGVRRFINAAEFETAVALRDYLDKVANDEELYMSFFEWKTRPLSELKPAFQKDGTVTAANASSISDGAAALTLMMADEAAAQGLKPIALIHGYDESAQDPEWFTTAPVTAIQNTLERVGWTLDEVDLWEVNEAFAVVALAAMHELGISHQKLNVNGGACALGHPIGASGARIVVSLIHAMIQRGDKKGIASLCIGGGEATAMAIEIV